jgi:site-specific DNA-methyltransferase (adenine-specific)
MMAFGGSRMWHRLACGVEDAGFELRDSIAWLYGQGFPKSLDVSKEIDKAAGHWRGRRGPVLYTPGTMAGPTYVHAEKGAPVTTDAVRWRGWGTALKPSFEPVVVARKPLAGTTAANVLAYGTGALNVDGCRTPTQPADQRLIDRRGIDAAGRWPTNAVLDASQAEALDTQNADVSRFFPTFRYQAKAPTGERPSVDGVVHPTVKPVELMRWLVRLVTPPGGIVLDPFGGSGTTGEAAAREGFRCVLVEREKTYLPLVVSRLDALEETGWDLL